MENVQRAVTYTCPQCSLHTAKTRCSFIQIQEENSNEKVTALFRDEFVHYERNMNLAGKKAAGKRSCLVTKKNHEKRERLFSFLKTIRK